MCARVKINHDDDGDDDDVEERTAERRNISCIILIYDLIDICRVYLLFALSFYNIYARLTLARSLARI